MIFLHNSYSTFSTHRKRIRPLSLIKIKFKFENEVRWALNLRPNNLPTKKYFSHQLHRGNNKQTRPSRALELFPLDHYLHLVFPPGDSNMEQKKICVDPSSSFRQTLTAPSTHALPTAPHCLLCSFDWATLLTTLSPPSQLLSDVTRCSRSRPQSLHI